MEIVDDVKSVSYFLQEHLSSNLVVSNPHKNDILKRGWKQTKYKTNKNIAMLN